MRSLGKNWDPLVTSNLGVRGRESLTSVIEEEREVPDVEIVVGLFESCPSNNLAFTRLEVEVDQYSTVWPQPYHVG